ncbi:MAG: hypothetical protein ACJ762_16930 [Solirubrobacteraceae bacterium]
MASKAAITIMRPPDEVRRLWADSAYRPDYAAEAADAVTFLQAPGDRGTEVVVDLEKETPGGKLGAVVEKLTSAVPRAKVMDDLRHFKQLVETGVVAQSDGTPEGERFERKTSQRPAQPLDAAELQEVRS